MDLFWTPPQKKKQKKVIFFLEPKWSNFYLLQVFWEVERGGLKNKGKSVSFTKKKCLKVFFEPNAMFLGFFC